MSQHLWGDNDTEFFYELTPEKILNAIEENGYHCTGRLTALNSMENRVYDIEIEGDYRQTPNNCIDNFRVVKFYRPGRWSTEQIREEHEFLLDLQQQEISVIAPLLFDDGSTIKTISGSSINFTLFPKMGGRAPDELNNEQLEQLGRLLARVHNVGASKACQHRLELGPHNYGCKNLEYLLEYKKIPERYEEIYQDLVDDICEISDPWFDGISYQRIHGDCHLGNIIWRNDEAFLLDFDDMVFGPAVQDIWLLVPGRDTHSLQQRNTLLNAYRQMRDFDIKELKLVEALRALRFIHFSAWIAKRYEDPSFQRMFPDFGTDLYWQTQVLDLQEQLKLIQELSLGA